MANIAEEEQWEEGVYQLETTDPVQGGPDGVDNAPHKALANRTLWLKAKIEQMPGTISQMVERLGATYTDVVNTNNDGTIQEFQETLEEGS